VFVKSRFIRVAGIGLMAGGAFAVAACNVPQGTQPSSNVIAVTTTTTVRPTTTVPTTTVPPVTTVAAPRKTTQVTYVAPKPAPTAKQAPPPPPPPPPATISCTASMSNSSPADYSTTDVLVQTANGATVTTTAHYKTTDTTHSATASGGIADIPYRISDATAGYPVQVDVTVSSGTASGSCDTSFTPVR
jgi:hypothetical protein